MSRIAIVFANLVLGFPAALLLLKSLYELLARPYGRLHCALVAAAAGGLVATLALRPSVKINLALTIVATGVGLYVIELHFLYLYGYNEMAQIAALMVGRPVDGRTKIAVLQDLRRTGHAQPCVRPSLMPHIRIDGLETLPLGGVSNTTTVGENETGQYLIYNSDEHGFPNPHGIWSLPVIDILAVGDSFTHGCCVSSDKNLVSRIRQHYPATLNLAMPGNGPLVELAAILEYAPLLKPRIVLWGYHDNDLNDLEREKPDGLLMRYPNEDGFGQRLIERQRTIDIALTDYLAAAETSGSQLRPQRLPLVSAAARVLPLWIQDVIGIIEPESTITGGTLQLSQTRAYLRYLHTNRGEYRPFPGSPDFSLIRAIFEKAKTTVASWGGTVYLVNLPRVNPGKTYVEQRRRINQQLFAVLTELGIPIIDLQATFDQCPNLSTLTYFPRSHYSEEGYRVAAEAVLDVLIREGKDRR
jgi:hypothetical protein